MHARARDLWLAKGKYGAAVSNTSLHDLRWPDGTVECNRRAALNSTATVDAGTRP